MNYNDQRREKRNAWLFIVNITLLTLMHVTLTLGHAWDSLVAEHGRPKRASA